MKANDTLENFKKNFEQDENLQREIKKLRDSDRTQDIDYGNRKHSTLVDTTMFILLGFEGRNSKTYKWNEAYTKNVAPQQSTWEQNITRWLSNNSDKSLSSNIKEDIFNIDRSKVSFNDLQKELEEIASRNENINKNNILSILKCVKQIVNLI